MSSLRLLPFLLAPALFSCASLRKPLTCPESGGRSWTEVTSAHFVLKTDLDADDATKESARLEDMYSAISDLGFPSTDKPKMRIDVVHFRRHEDYAEIGSKMSGGVFLGYGRHDLERVPVAIYGGDMVERTVITLKHELTHRFVHYYYPQAPAWLNEGFAEYFATLALDDGQATLGRAPVDTRFWKGPWHWEWNPKGWNTLAPVSEAPRTSELRAMKPEQFYGDQGLEPTTLEGRKAFKTLTTHYQGAWCFVHLLKSDASYEAPFNEYLQRLHVGESDEAAWAKTLGRIPTEKLEADYHASLAPKEVLLLRTKYAPNAVAPEHVRAMSDAEVHVLWARLRPWDAAESRAAASADLEEARKADAFDPDLALVESQLARKNGASHEAKAALERAIERHAGDRRLWNALGWITLSDAPSTKNGDKATAAALAPIAERLRERAQSAPELDLLAHVSLVNGQPDDALAYEKRAMATDPNCVDCLVLVSRALYEKRLFTEAADMVTFALGLVQEGARPQGLVALIDAYRHQARVLSPSQLEQALTPYVKALKEQCGSHVPASATTETVGAELLVDASGRVKEATLTGGDPDLRECLDAKIRDWQFPTAREETRVTVPLRFANAPSGASSPAAP
jgi:tetratricopeptide (TPR) repeat protein